MTGALAGAVAAVGQSADAASPSPWAFHPHPDIIALCLTLLVGYGYALRRFGPLFHPQPGDVVATRRQRGLFVFGVALLFVALGWPVHDLGEHYLYTAHMIQHLLIGFAVLPLLLLGTPEWLARLLLGTRGRARVLAWLTRPVVAIITFNVGLALIHWPAVVDLMLTNAVFHGGIHLLFLAASFVLWLPLVSPLPEMVRMSPPAKMAYLFVQTILPTIPGAFLVFGERPIYARYAEFPRLWGLSPVDDMQLAGFIMKLGTATLLGAVIAVMFFRWAATEQVPVVSAEREPTPHEPSTPWS